MPIYEYRCQDCGVASSLFFRSIGAVSAPSCPTCGGGRMVRLISRAFHLKGDRARLAELDTSRLMGGLEGRDPGAFARWARQVDAEVGSGLGTNFRELAEKAEAGEDPIERYDPEHTLRYAVQKRVQEASGSSESEGAGDAASGR